MNNKNKISVIAISIIIVTSVAVSFPSVEKFIFKVASNQYDQKNYKTAFFFYHLVLFKGYYIAKNNIATMYLYGEGTQKNYKKAFEYFKVAAEKGLAVSQFNLGSLYATGRGVDQDLNQSFEYYKKAALEGLKTAEVILKLARPSYLGEVNPIYWFVIHIDDYKSGAVAKISKN